MEIYIKKGRIEIYSETITNTNHSIVYNSPINIEYYLDVVKIFQGNGFPFLIKKVSDITKINNGVNLPLPSTLFDLYNTLKSYVDNPIDSSSISGGGSGGISQITTTDSYVFSTPEIRTFSNINRYFKTLTLSVDIRDYVPRNQNIVDYSFDIYLVNSINETSFLFIKDWCPIPNDKTSFSIPYYSDGLIIEMKNPLDTKTGDSVTLNVTCTNV